MCDHWGGSCFGLDEEYSDDDSKRVFVDEMNGEKDNTHAVAVKRDFIQISN